MITAIEARIMSAMQTAIPGIAMAGSLPDPDMALTGVPPQGDVVVALAKMIIGDFNAINYRRSPVECDWVIRLRLRDMRSAGQVTPDAYNKLEAAINAVHGLEIDPSTYVFIQDIQLTGYGDGTYVYDIRCSCSVMVFN
jgi:hypothetical protein